MTVSGESLRPLTLPNALSLMRLAAAPLVMVEVANGEDGRAALWLLLAGLTDGVDGWIARRMHQGSLLGRYLDPVADKALLWGVGTQLWLVDRFPAPLLGAWLLRDGGQLCWMLSRAGRLSRSTPRPAATGKAATLLGLLALLTALGPAATRRLVDPLALSATLFVGLSAVQYFRQWLKHSPTTPACPGPSRSPSSPRPATLRGAAPSGRRTPGGRPSSRRS